MGLRVLILDNAVHRLLFKPAWHWKAALGAIATDVVNLPSGRPVPSLSRYTHVILTGSEASILNPRPWFDVEAGAVLEASDRGLPILGSCFGHQMLVYALSGSDYLRRSASPEVGWIEVDMFEPDELLAHVARPWRVFSFHFDEVVDPPAPWKVLARSDRCAVHAVRYGNRPTWGIQPHPEMSERKAEVFARLYLLLYGGADRKTITGLRRPKPRDRAIHGIVQRFLETERAA